MRNLADKIGVSLEEVQAWIEGKSRPALSKFRRLATSLHRPTALFLLPSPPTVERPPIRFRRPTGDLVRPPNPDELRALRQAARMQRVLAWIAVELGNEVTDFPMIQLETGPEDAAERVRTWMGIPGTRDLARGTPSQAFDAWRERIEANGILVFLCSLGAHSCRGFSLWNSSAPIAAVNTYWREEARIFTLLHELGHLITRTSSACVDGVRLPRTGGDQEERWCEKFAAALLLPRQEVLQVLREQLRWRPNQRVIALDDARILASKFSASLRAAVLRLVEINIASWSLYEAIPAVSDQKEQSRGGRGRTRREIREDQYGRRTAQLFHCAVDRELISRSQAVDYLDVPDVEFDRLGLGSRLTGP
ncbi:MAG: ImmA/IrrE family metallo-endopeptidase [Acidobacteria bacterium]|nr:ImmA/IrrE family metallo-endopeptidase [Acidobacteriota bacterium]